MTNKFNLWIKQKDGTEVLKKPGDTVETFKGEIVKLMAVTPNRVIVKHNDKDMEREYFPSVVSGRIEEAMDLRK